MRILFALLFFLMTGGYAVAANTWKPIIGIPEPPFGITTSHTMYADCNTYKYDYGSGPECYRIGSNGPYTHYVDPNHPNATDTNNPYGTVAKPRLTRPNSISGNPIYGDPLPPGSVVEMHSGAQGGIGQVNISGTASLPIFLRGVEGDEPTFPGILFLGGSYIVIENIKFDMKQSNNPVITIGSQDVGAQSNIAIRNCEIYNGQYVPSESYQIIRIKNSNGNAHLIQNVVVYKNHFHNIGDGRTTSVKTDAVAVSIDANVKYVWIIGNTFNHIGGDGIQVAWDKFATSTEMPQYIYIGKNTAHDCYENFLDLKMCQDVIVSQNTAYNFGDGYCSIGGGSSIAYRYGLGEGPDDVARNNVWTLFNVIHDFNAPDGGFAQFTGTGEMYATEMYFISNVAYNGHDDTGKTTGFGSNSSQAVYWINNTAYNCDRSAFFTGDTDDSWPNEKLTVVNNIFGDIHSGSTVPRNLQLGGTETSIGRMVIKNNIFYNSSGDTKFYMLVYNPIQLRPFNTYNAFCTAYSSFCTGSMEDNPDHVNAVNADFHLISASPAINASAAHSAYTTFESRYGISIQVDYNNHPVPDGIAHDIGAYEYLRPLPPKNLQIIP